MSNVMEINNQDTFRTKDLYLSAFLKARGLNLLDTEREGLKVFFIFRGQEKAEKLIKEFTNGGQVSISLFVGAINDLKTLIYNR